MQIMTNYVSICIIITIINYIKLNYDHTEASTQHLSQKSNLKMGKDKDAQKTVKTKNKLSTNGRKRGE